LVQQFDWAYCIFSNTDNELLKGWKDGIYLSDKGRLFGDPMKMGIGQMVVKIKVFFCYKGLDYNVQDEVNTLGDVMVLRKNGRADLLSEKTN
jgi:hypothetical protein